MSARVASTPYARALARRAGVALAGLRGSGPGGRVVAADVLRHAGAEAAPAAAPSAGAAGGPAPRRVRSTPYARTLARARGIDLGRIAGSGPGGRVVARDLAPRILTVAAPVAAAAALCARLNGALPSGAVPVAPADVVAAAAVRAVRGPVAWTLDGATARWIVAPGMRLAAIAAARAAAAGDGGASAGGGGLVLLRATLAAGGAVLQLAFPPGADAGGGAAADAAAIVARLRETIAWPAALLL